jgi:hypothetical protein
LRSLLALVESSFKCTMMIKQDQQKTGKELP